MVPVWAAVLGMIGTLAGAGVTQVATNRREANRDAMRWAQERQQRALDSQMAALATALTALNNWFSELASLNQSLADPYERQPDTAALPRLEIAARGTVASVQLLCSEEAASVTTAAISSLDAMAYNLRIAAKHATGRFDGGTELAPHAVAMNRVADVYRAELATLSAGSVVPTERPKARRMRLK